MVNFERVLGEVEKSCRDRSVYMLGPEKADFISALVKQKNPSLAVECGTAIGYSGLWIARALKENGQGKLITLEIDSARAQEARKNFAEAEVGQWIDSRIGDAEDLLHALDERIDFLFLDNDYGNYMGCFRAAEPNLQDGAMIVADNVGVGASSMTEYLELVRSRYDSYTRWFNTDLPWLTKDAVEISKYRAV